MKYRVLETQTGSFHPQFKPGFFSGWRFFCLNAEVNMEQGYMLQSLMETRDPAHAAVFASVEGARGFITRIKEMSAAYWAEHEARRDRVACGVERKRVYKV